ncbi:MAG: hypothetical protein ACTSQS_15725 [Promethearchaeota archaeon]
MLYYPGIFGVPPPHVGSSLGIVIPVSPGCGHVRQETGGFSPISRGGLWFLDYLIKRRM